MSILPQLERDLFEAAKERLPAADDPAPGVGRHGRLGPTQAARWQRGRLTRAVAGLWVLLALVVTVVIAAVALTAFKHGHASSSTAGVGSASSSRQQLIQTLGVLRRPQAKSDLDTRAYPPNFQIPGPLAHRHPRAPAWLVRWGYPELDRPLVRVVTTVHGDKVSIAPATWQPALPSTRRAEGLIIAIQDPGSGVTGTGPGPTSVAALRADGLAVFTYGANDTNRGVVVVPDGVAKVTLGPVRIPLSEIPIIPRPTATTTSAVHNNVAAFQLSGLDVVSPALRSGLYGVNAVTQMTWLSPTGSVLHQITTNLNLVLNVKHQGPGQGCIPFSRHLRARFRAQHKAFAIHPGPAICRTISTP